METKINYHKEALKIIKQIEGTRPKLLAHVCCGPCATYPIKFLNDYFDVTLIYSNSNIYPKEEYEKRLLETQKFLDGFNKEYSSEIKLIVPNYDEQSFQEKLKQLADEPEGGKRCLICYHQRLMEGFRYASEHGFNYFTTVMTISPHKDGQILNKIGKQLQTTFPNVTYFVSDYKKDGGFYKANEMSRHYHLYRQNYCGCRFSFKQMLKRVDEQKES